MLTIAKLIHFVFPLLGLLLLLLGLWQKKIPYVISSLWLSLIGLTIHYQASGGEILGSYFDYLNASIYSINVIILCISLIYMIAHLNSSASFFKYTNSFLQAFILIGSGLLLINIWVNAYFIENRMQGTPVMQVALTTKPDYCSYKYLFYKVTPEGTISYLCPNYYGLLPQIGHLPLSPDFIANQLPLSAKEHLLQLQKKS